MSVFRPEKTVPKLHTEVKTLNSSEYQTDKNLAALIKKLYTAPIEWGKLTKSFSEKKDYKASDKELPGIFLEMHVDGILKELATNNKNYICDPIPEGFSTDHYIFKKNNWLGQTIVHPQGINSTSLTYCEYDNLLLVANEKGDNNLIVIEAKSGSLGDATTEEYRDKLFKPLKEFRQTAAEFGISGLGYMLITTNKQKPNHLRNHNNGNVRFSNTGAFVCINEFQENFVTNALKAGKTMR